MIRPRTSSSRASASSWVILSFSTSRLSLPSVIARAFSIAASTNFWSMSLTTTGMSAVAIACAISPPIVPPPTTAALETNMWLGPPEYWLCDAAGAAGAEAIRSGA